MDEEAAVFDVFVEPKRSLDALKGALEEELGPKRSPPGEPKRAPSDTRTALTFTAFVPTDTLGAATEDGTAVENVEGAAKDTSAETVVTEAEDDAAAGAGAAKRSKGSLFVTVTTFFTTVDVDPVTTELDDSTLFSPP